MCLRPLACYFPQPSFAWKFGPVYTLLPKRIASEGELDEIISAQYLAMVKYLTTKLGTGLGTLSWS